MITIKYLKKKKMTISLQVPIKGHKLKRLGTSDLYAKTVRVQSSSSNQKSCEEKM